MGIILLLLITGFLLLILEFFVIPGTTISGIGGLAMIVVGIYIAYGIDSSTGNITLASTLLASIVILIYALRAKTWKKFMLNSSINSHVDTVEENSIKIGDHGKTISRLNPMGRIRINDQEIEAHSTGPFLDPKTEIEVTEVFKTYIIVKPVN